MIRPYALYNHYSLTRAIPINPALPQTAGCLEEIERLRTGTDWTSHIGIERSVEDWELAHRRLADVETSIGNLRRQIRALNGETEVLSPPWWRLRLIDSLPPCIATCTRLWVELRAEHPKTPRNPEIQDRLEAYKIQIDALRQKAAWEAEYGPWTASREAEYQKYKGKDAL